MPPINRKNTSNSVAMFGRSRAVESELAQLLNRQQHKSVLGMLKSAEQMGLEKEEFAQELKDELARIKRRQKKAKKKGKLLELLSFVPGGKWLKPVIKAGTAFYEADKMKNLLEDISTSFEKGYGNTFLQEQARGFSEKLWEQKSKIDPTRMFAQSFFGDIISPGFGKQETFRGLKEKKKQIAGENWFNKAMTDKFGGEFIPQKFTPWKDHLRGKFGLLKDEKFGERLTRGWGDLMKSDVFEGMGRVGLTSGPDYKDKAKYDLFSGLIEKNPEYTDVFKQYFIDKMRGGGK